MEVEHRPSSSMILQFQSNAVLLSSPVQLPAAAGLGLASIAGGLTPMIVARRRFPKKNLALQVIRDNTQLQILFFLHLFTGFYMVLSHDMNYSAGSAQRIVKSNCWVPIELLLGVKTYLGTL